MTSANGAGISLHLDRYDDHPDYLRIKQECGGNDSELLREEQYIALISDVAIEAKLIAEEITEKVATQFEQCLFDLGMEFRDLHDELVALPEDQANAERWATSFMDLNALKAKWNSEINFCYHAYNCEDGYSANWGQEFRNQGVSTYPGVVHQEGLCNGSCDSKEKCADLCHAHGAYHFNWMYQRSSAGLYACRCYNDVQRSSINVEGTGWSMCSWGNRVLFKEIPGKYCNPLGSGYPDANTLDACQALCVNNASCTAISFYANGFNDMCYLHEICTEETSVSGGTIYYKIQPVHD